MKKNAAIREFKKLKGQVKQIEEIVKHSKAGALIEHETAVRKKLKLLYEMKDEGFKEYHDVCDNYEELLEVICKKILEDYNRKNETSFDYHDVVRGKAKSLINSGFMTVLTKQHIPQLIAKEFEDTFPDNPKDEYLVARALKRKFYIHLGDTNTGKTYNAVERLKTAKKGVYLSPLRILALENYEKLNKQGIVCDLMTGEEEIIQERATHVSCTIEKVNLSHTYDIAVIDEIQMINDSQRGSAWSRALLGLRCSEIHICGAMNAKELLKIIIEDCEDDYEIKEYYRNTPLEVEQNNFSYNHAMEGDALVLFSKKRVLQTAQSYSERGEKTSIIYGDLPPEVRKMQYEQFINKETKVLVTTDAIGMGVNLPIRRIVFMSIKKFDGEEVRELTSQEVKQVAGRAGRKGIYDIGYVATVGDAQNFIARKLEMKDPTIAAAVIGPSESILSIKNLPLNEKLALWSNREEKLDYYRKMDISDYLFILEKIKRYRLKEKDQWDLLKVPFDISSEELLETFIQYVDEVFVVKEKIISKPQCFTGNLDDLEIYYQKINMYYSFSKLFNLDFDSEWVYSERRKVSNDINEILVKM